MGDGRTPRGECGNCGSRFPEDDTFTYRGFHFCVNCVMSLGSWLLNDDGVLGTDPDMFAWVEAPDSGAPAAVCSFLIDPVERRRCGLREGDEMHDPLGSSPLRHPFQPQPSVDSRVPPSAASERGSDG